MRREEDRDGDQLIVGGGAENDRVLAAGGRELDGHDGHGRSGRHPERHSARHPRHGLPVSLVAALSVPNPVLWAIVFLALVLLTVALVAAPARALFDFAPLDATGIRVVAAASTVAIAWLDAIRVIRARRSRWRGAT